MFPLWEANKRGRRLKQRTTDLNKRNGMKLNSRRKTHFYIDAGIVKLTRFQGSLRGEIGENPENEINSQ